MLMERGHPDAWIYPVCTLWYEAEIVTYRANNDFATTGITLQMAVASILSKESGKMFSLHINKLMAQ